MTDQHILIEAIRATLNRNRFISVPTVKSKIEDRLLIQL
jgi:hypothetical protein